MGVLDPVIRRRVAAILLIAGVLVAVLAIRDIGPFSDPPSAEDRATNVVERFFDAASEGDFKAFCDLLTVQAREDIETRAAAISARTGLERCDEILGVLAKHQFSGSEATILDVNVEGPRARVEVGLKLRGQPGREQRTVLLQELRGKWLVTDPGFG